MTTNVQTLALLVKAAYRLGMREMNAALADLGLTAAQAEALAVLAQAGPLSLNQQGGLLIAEGGHPSRLVDRLVSAGWVARQEAADDRRRVTLRLTAAGARGYTPRPSSAPRRSLRASQSDHLARMSKPPAPRWPPASRAPTSPRSSTGAWPIPRTPPPSNPWHRQPHHRG